MEKLSPFSFVNAINFTKENIFNDETKNQYIPFIINRNFSNFIDTIFQAQEMNLNHTLDKKMQFAYYINIIKKGKRFAKWYKKEKGEDLKLIREYYGYNVSKAESALKILSSENIKKIRDEVEKGT